MAEARQARATGYADSAPEDAFPDPDVGPLEVLAALGPLDGGTGGVATHWQ
jgi:hypothetical protein